MNAGYDRHLLGLSESEPVTRSDGRAVRVLDRGVLAPTGRTLVIAVVVNPGVVRVII
jgi:hypothetical protein